MCVALGTPRLLGVLALGDLLDDLGAERRQVVWVAARDETLVGDDLLIHPLTARVADVRLQARVGSQCPTHYHVRLYQRPGTMADHTYRLLLLEEPTHELYRLLVCAQIVCPYGAPRYDQGIVVLHGDVREGLLYGKSLTHVNVAVHSLGFSGLDADHVYVGTGVLDSLLGLGELDLLTTHRSKQDGYLASLQLVRHAQPPLQITAFNTSLIPGDHQSQTSLECLLIHSSPNGMALCGRWRLACDLRAGRGAKSVEYRFFEALFSEPVPGGIREEVGLCCGDEGDGAAAEARSGEPRAQSAGLARGLDEGVELGGRDLEIVAHGEVRVVHEATEGREIFLPQRPDRFENPGVLKDNVASALELFALEPVQVLLPGVPELPYS